jgi:hypothetical protein
MADKSGFESRGERRGWQEAYLFSVTLMSATKLSTGVLSTEEQRPGREAAFTSKYCRQQAE